jgi:uncharacterized repeat protein (TIGR01451 family)
MGHKRHRAVSLIGGLLLLIRAIAPMAEEPAEVSTDAVSSELVAEVREEANLPQRPPLLRYQPATAITQGQTVFYTVRVRNHSPVPVRDAIAVQKIPSNTVYVLGSASGPATEITFSIDGGQTFGSEGQLRITPAVGAARRPLANEYTHIRWRLRNPLAPGATALARFQATFQ